MRRPILAISIVALTAPALVACGGGETPTAAEPTEDTTAGGEVDQAAIEAHPMRTTTPVPVPQPAVAREELSEPLQAVWTQVEEVVAIRPPAGPEEATEEAVQAWAEGAFREWIDTRSAAMREAVATSEGVPAEPAHERAIASALLGYALEDFVADVRGSPVPEDVATDEELLGVYVEHLTSVLRPMAIEAVISYAYCQRRLAELGDESVWLPWRAYCVQRGREVIATYELEPHEMQPGQTEPGDEAPSEGEGEGPVEGAPAEGEDAEEEDDPVG